MKSEIEMLRLALGLSVRDLAREVGISKSAAGRLMQGEWPSRAQSCAAIEAWMVAVSGRLEASQNDAPPSGRPAARRSGWNPPVGLYPNALRQHRQSQKERLTLERLEQVKGACNYGYTN